MKPVYIIEESGATWVFTDHQRWVDGFQREVLYTGFDGPGELLAYSGEIPDEEFEVEADGTTPTQDCIDFVMNNLSPALREE